MIIVVIIAILLHIITIAPFTSMYIMIIMKREKRISVDKMTAGGHDGNDDPTAADPSNGEPGPADVLNGAVVRIDHMACYCTVLPTCM